MKKNSWRQKIHSDILIFRFLGGGFEKKSLNFKTGHFLAEKRKIKISQFHFH